MFCVTNVGFFIVFRFISLNISHVQQKWNECIFFDDILFPSHLQLMLLNQLLTNAQYLEICQYPRNGASGIAHFSKFPPKASANGMERLQMPQRMIHKICILSRSVKDSLGIRFLLRVPRSTSSILPRQLDECPSNLLHPLPSPHEKWSWFVHSLTFVLVPPWVWNLWFLREISQ